MPIGSFFRPSTRAGAVAAIILLNGSAAATGCLSAPNQTPAEGEHWSYRTNRETNQKCWYLRGRDVATGAKPTLQGAQAKAEELFSAFLRWKNGRDKQ